MRQDAQSIAAVLEVLDRGERPGEGEVVRALRSGHCPAALVERLASSRWTLAAERVLPLVVGHPACPRHFAWEALPRLGWRDLVALAASPRTPPPVRRQAERRLSERVPLMTRGERVAVARVASRAVVLAMLGTADELCVEALLDNPHLTEMDVVRLVVENLQPGCAASVLRHRRWGASRSVRQAAVRSPAMPLGVAMGVLATFSAGELEASATAADVPGAVRAAAELLLTKRTRGGEGETPPPLALRP